MDKLVSLGEYRRRRDEPLVPIRPVPAPIQRDDRPELGDEGPWDGDAA